MYKIDNKVVVVRGIKRGHNFDASNIMNHNSQFNDTMFRVYNEKYRFLYSMENFGWFEPRFHQLTY